MPPVILVTGSSRGLGRGIAQHLAGRGYSIAINYARNATAADETLALCEAGRQTDDQRFLTVQADVADAADRSRMLAEILAHFGRLDCLVNNAGGVEIAPIEATGDDLLQRTFEVNAFSPARLIAASWPIFQKQRSGCVVNVSSRSTVDPFPGLSVYAAAKSALESLARSIINEGRSMGITAYTVAPGAVETPMLRALWSEDELPPSQAMAPDEVARVIVDCILGRREQDLGQTIRI